MLGKFLFWPSKFVTKLAIQLVWLSYSPVSLRINDLAPNLDLTKFSYLRTIEPLKSEGSGVFTSDNSPYWLDPYTRVEDMPIKDLYSIFLRDFSINSNGSMKHAS